MEMKPADAKNVQKLVMAGMTIMYDAKTFPIFERGLSRKAVPIPQRLAMEVAGLMKMLMERSGGKIPRQIIIPAALMLLAEMAHFMAQADIDKPTGDDLNKAKSMLPVLLKKLFPAGQQPQAQTPAEPQAPAAPAALQAPAAQPAPAGIMQGA